VPAAAATHAAGEKKNQTAPVSVAEVAEEFSPDAKAKQELSP
jgi:hypothetical protein